MILHKKLFQILFWRLIWYLHCPTSYMFNHMKSHVLITVCLSEFSRFIKTHWPVKTCIVNVQVHWQNVTKHDLNSPPSAEAQSFEDEWQQKVSHPKSQPFGPGLQLEEPRSRVVHRAAITGSEQAHRSVVCGQNPGSQRDGSEHMEHWHTLIAEMDSLEMLSVILCYDAAKLNLGVFSSNSLHRNQSKGKADGKSDVRGSKTTKQWNWLCACQSLGHCIETASLWGQDENQVPQTLVSKSTFYHCFFLFSEAGCKMWMKNE